MLQILQVTGSKGSPVCSSSSSLLDTGRRLPLPPTGISPLLLILPLRPLLLALPTAGIRRLLLILHLRPLLAAGTGFFIACHLGSPVSSVSLSYSSEECLTLPTTGPRFFLKLHLRAPASSGSSSSPMELLDDP